MATKVDPTLHCPRILCLHGGGTNAAILELQARTFVPALAPYFRLVYADAPFFCAPHPAIIPVYSDFAPFRLWTRWNNSQAVPGGSKDSEIDTVLHEMEYQIRSAMEADDAKGATGEWVGLLGFSQGARVAGSILFEQQLRQEEQANDESEDSETETIGFAGGKWKFAVLMAGRGPWISLSPLGDKIPTTRPPNVFIEPNTLRPATLSRTTKKLRLPTIHVLGTKDPGLPHHQQMYDIECDRRSATVFRWEGDHRLPFRSVDVDPIVEAIITVGQQSGAFSKP